MLHSQLSKQELLKRLESETELTGKLGLIPYFPRTYKVFRGRIQGDNFEIIAAPTHLKTFIPTYKGKVKQHHGYTAVEITMNPHLIVRGVLSFLIFILLTLCVVLSALILQALFNPHIYHDYHPSILFVLLLLVTAPVLKVLPFNFRSDEGLSDLMALFHAKITND